MEKDFEGFINYVYELKKNKDIGVSNEITDIDLYQWRKSLQEKEQERLKLLEDALNNIDSKQRFLNNASVFRQKDDQIFQTAMDPPHILDSLGKGNLSLPRTQDYPNQYSSLNKGSDSDFNQYEDNNFDDVLKQYYRFKERTEKMQQDRQKMESEAAQYMNNNPPPSSRHQPLPNLRDPEIRNLYQQKEEIRKQDSRINDFDMEDRDEEMKQPPNQMINAVDRPGNTSDIPHFEFNA